MDPNNVAMVSGPLDTPPIDKRHDDGEVGEHIKVGATLFLDGNVDEPVIVKYVGGTKFNKRGIWVGIALRNATGKHGGLVNGHRYFTCKPKHGLFVRAERLYEDYFCPGDGTQRPSVQKARPSTAPSRIAPKTEYKLRTSKAIPKRRHPLLDQPRINNATKKKELRYYIDNRGRVMHTLKEIDPYGRQTLLLHEPTTPTVCLCKNHSVDHKTNGCSAQQQQQLDHEKDSIAVGTSMSVSTAVGSDEPLPLEYRLSPGRMIVTLSDQTDVVAHAAAASIAVGTDDPPSDGDDISTPLLHSDSNSNSQSSISKDDKNTTEDTFEVVETDPHATGLSDNESGDDADDEWRPNLDIDLQDLAEKIGSNQRMGKLSTVAECSALAKRLKRAAIAEDWPNVRDMLCDEAAELAVEEQTLKNSGVGKVVGKLRQAPNLAVAFAAESVIEAWKFQLKIEPSEQTRTIQAKVEYDRKRLHAHVSSLRDLGISSASEAEEDFLAPVVRERRANATPGSRSKLNQSKGSTECEDGDASSTRRRLEDSLRPLQIHLDSDPELPDEINNVESDTDTASSSRYPKQSCEIFVGLSILEQCEELTDQLRELVTSENWAAILDLLRGTVTGLLVTEDALRRSGIGRILAKIVKKTSSTEVKHQAQEIINRWKEYVKYRDPVADKMDAKEQKEREKFLEFMNLQPVALHGASREMGSESDADSVGTPNEPENVVYFEKNFKLKRGPRDKSLGFRLTMYPTPSGAVEAKIAEVLPGGLADRASKDGCEFEQDDKLLEINGISVANCSKTEIVELLKAEELDLTLQSVVPGTEDGSTGIEEGENIYNTSSLPVFHNVKVNPSDFIALQSA